MLIHNVSSGHSAQTLAGTASNDAFVDTASFPPWNGRPSHGPSVIVADRERHHRLFCARGQPPGCASVRESYLRLVETLGSSERVHRSQRQDARWRARGFGGLTLEVGHDAIRLRPHGPLRALGGAFGLKRDLVASKTCMTVEHFRFFVLPARDWIVLRSLADHNLKQFAVSPSENQVRRLRQALEMAASCFVKMTNCETQGGAPSLISVPPRPRH